MEHHDARAIVPADQTKKENRPMGDVVRLFPGARQSGQVGPQTEQPVISGRVLPPAEPAPSSALPGLPSPAWQGAPLCPADAGWLRYAASVAGHGTAKSPVAVWDRWWDWVKLAPMREGGTHRGQLAERHQAAYVKIQQDRAEKVGKVARAVTWPWHTYGKAPVISAGTWVVTTGEIVYAANPTSYLLAHTVGLVNSALGELLAGLGALAAPLALPAAAVGAVAAWGHSMKVEHARRRRLLLVRQGAEVGIKEDGELLPAMPLEECPHAQTVLEATRRNLAIEGLIVKPLSAVATPWGWEVVVQMRKGEPGDITAKSSRLETLFDIQTNGALVQPHIDRRARATLRLIESNPWSDMPQVPDYTTAPRTARDPIWLGQRLDGVQVAGPWAAKQTIVLAASGGGKSIVLRVLADGLGAAKDMHIWDLDPSGVGQAPQAGLMGRVALTPEDCEVALAHALAIAAARTRLLRVLKMGDAWQCSPERPGIAIFIDEFPRLTKTGKQLAVALLRVVRKAGMQLIFAAQDAKKDAIGESIAGQMACKIGGPGLIDWQADLLWGPGCKGQGWDPGRYRPATDEHQPNDAGTFYCSGVGTPGGDLALPTRIGYMPRTLAETRTAHYVALGCCPDIDAQTLQRAGLTPEEVYVVTDDESADLAQRTAAVTPVEADSGDQELPAEVRALLEVCARVFIDAPGEWIPADAIAELAATEFGWEMGRATEMRVAALLDAAGVPKARKGGKTSRLRTGVLVAAGVDLGGALSA